jgi:hypothetical protein
MKLKQSSGNRGLFDKDKRLRTASSYRMSELAQQLSPTQSFRRYLPAGSGKTNILSEKELNL